jgi:DMSO/TMAO reductase YedYZ molybdopterin-dependent catalytic subunit
MEPDIRRLPPGQHRIDRFPRFGVRLDRPLPAVTETPTIEICGVVAEPIVVPLADLAALPRLGLTADFHCVAGWSATDLHWEGVAFETFYRLVIQPALSAGTVVTYAVFEGLDSYRSIVWLEDALRDDVILAEHLNGRPLDGDHGAPLRLVSPSQYGFVSTKHLCRIELHATEPKQRYHSSPFVQAGLQIVKPHRRARVWREERHRHLPAWFVRPVYRHATSAIRFLRARKPHRPRQNHDADRRTCAG